MKLRGNRFEVYRLAPAKTRDGGEWQVRCMSKNGRCIWCSGQPMRKNHAIRFCQTENAKRLPEHQLPIFVVE
ncbi:MAG TPA: hypothetical protein VLH56_11775 [Dissulfurispiraceae bacterium]|nr:hypothetical protein [Dissulfurispiraceae bacterium]